MTTHSLSVDDSNRDSDKKEEKNKLVFCFYLDFEKFHNYKFQVFGSSFVAEVTLIFRE